MLGTLEIALIVIAVVVLFGGKKIPELARGIGSSFKEFKDGIEGGSKNSATTNTAKSKPKSKPKTKKK